MALRALLAIVGLALAACGGSPAAPAPAASFVLSAGPHTLTISIAQTITINPIGFTTSALVCTGSGPGSVAIPVVLAREGQLWVARPSSGSLVVRLTEVPGGVTGSMEGSAGQSGVTVVVNNGAAQPAPATLPATPFSGVGAGGPIDGSVRFATAQGDQSCSSNAWSLVPRS